MWTPTPDHPIRKMFAGLTEHAFYAELGITDTALIDYLTDLLTRFIHVDEACVLRDGQGQPMAEVADMIREAEAMPLEGRTRREAHRYIGDYTLFWTGLYPETVKKKSSRWCKDQFIDYFRQGKYSYRIAAAFEDDPWKEESAVLRRLSDDFEMCAYGLNQVRKEIALV